ncbi:MAG: InlB B-repeat-containing protein, partial [Christensenellales bacterium]
IWEPDKFTARFYDGDMEFKNLYTDTSYGSVLTAPTELIVKDGYTFDGWRTADGEKYDFGVLVKGDVKLYASWVEGNPVVLPNTQKTETGCNGQVTSMLCTLFIALAGVLSAKKW